MGQKVQGSSFSSTTRDAPELAALRGLVATSSGVCCVTVASSHASELAALQQQALERESLLLQRSNLRSLLAATQQASELFGSEA